MSETNALQRRPGELTNRVSRPSDWSVPGEYVWCLGSYEPGWTARLAPGNTAFVEQTASFGSATYFQAKLRLRGPAAALPFGWYWEAFAARGEVELWQRTLRPGLLVDVEDMVLPTAGQAEPLHVRLGLRLVGPVGASARDVELPLVLVAELSPQSATSMLLANSSPFPGERAAPQNLGGVLQVDVVDPTGGSPDPLLSEVYVNNVLAFSHGNTAHGWNGDTDLVAPGVLRFQLVPPSPFHSQSLVLVEVLSSTGSSALESNYSFTVEDKTPPRILQAQSRTGKTVRVSFSEVVGTTAEDLAAYSVVRLSAPAVEVVPARVERVSARELDLVLDIPITPRGQYQLVAQNVADSSGNFIDPPNNVVEFNGYEPPAPPGRDFQLWTMLPQLNRDEDVTEDLRKFISLLQEPLEMLLTDVDRWTEILDVDVAEERYLDQMLIQLGNPFSFELSEEDKRRLIRVLVPMMRQKGTASGIINTIRFFLGVEVEVRPLAGAALVWNLGEDRLGEGTFLATNNRRMFYSFEVVSSTVLTEVQRSRIRDVVDYMKAGHEHFVRLIEPTVPETIDHVELGLSRLATEFILH